MGQGTLKTLAAAVFIAAGASLSAAAPVTHTCGKPLGSVVLTETVAFTTSSTDFVQVPKARRAITVPAGQTRCVKVRFSAETGCSVTGNADGCFIRVGVLNGTIFDPPINGITFGYEDDSFRVRSFEWVKRLGEGAYIISAQAAVQNAATQFNIQVWTLSLEITE